MVNEIVKRRMKMQFKTDSEFISFLRRLYFKNGDPISSLDPFLIDGILHSSSAVYIQSQFPRTPQNQVTIRPWLFLFSEIRNQLIHQWDLQGVPDNCMAYQYLLMKAKELDREGTNATLKYIKDYMHSSTAAKTSKDVYLDPILSQVCALYNWHFQQLDQELLEKTHFWKLWNQNPTDFSRTQTAEELYTHWDLMNAINQPPP
jgi:hypothetical protein